MPDGHSNLSSLHAGRYGEGAGADYATISSGFENPPPPASDNCPNPRKRARREASKPDDGGDNKRGRGRPRLNVNEETAAERRRTQIRLAQRAYRNRKETTISSLEQQVRDLLDTNEEMSSAFTALQEFAASRGLLEQVPELGAQLQSAAEKFRSLSQRPSNTSDTGRHDDDSGERSATKSSSPDALVVSPHQPVTRKGKQQQYDGAIVTGESTTQHGLATPLPHLSSPERHSPGARQQHQKPIHSTSNSIDAAGFEIITHPTYENASFPFFFTDDQLSSILGQNPSPLGTAPPPPRTYSPAENTFGRRLQRFALECGLKLISSPNPPPLPLVRVFGFCLPFESPDMILDRLQQSLQRSENQSLNFWEYPFYNLGGAGTHFPPMPGSLVGNQGTVDLGRNSMGAGFPIGPSTRVVAETRDKLASGQRISVPGFQGDFYDAEEVEVYLRQKGVHIMPRQDIVTAEIDFAMFEDKKPTVLQPQQYQQQQASYSTLQPTSVYTGQAFVGISEVSNMGHFLPPTSLPAVEENVQALPVLPGRINSSPSVGLLNPELVDGPTGSHDTVSGGVAQDRYMLPSSHQYTASTDVKGSLSYTTATYSDSNVPSYTAPMQQFPSSRPSTTLISLDVNMFIKKLTETTTCLGRSPGFRLENVHKAFMAAIMRN